MLALPSQSPLVHPLDGPPRHDLILRGPRQVRRRDSDEDLPEPFLTVLDSDEHAAFRSSYRQFRAPHAKLSATEAKTVASIPAAAAAAMSRVLRYSTEGEAFDAAPLRIPGSASMPSVPRGIPSCNSMPVLPPGWAGGVPSSASFSTPSGKKAKMPPASPELLPSALMGSLPPRGAHMPSFDLPQTVVEVILPPSTSSQPSEASLPPSPSSSSSQMTSADGDAASEPAASVSALGAKSSPTVLSDAWLRQLFDDCVAQSAAHDEGSPERLIAYDASDCPVTKQEGSFTVRLDARRNKKPNPQAAALAADPTTDPNASVLVATDPDPAKFNFTKVNPREVLAEVTLSGPATEQADSAAPPAGRVYQLLPNKFPVASRHLLLVDGELSPQRLAPGPIDALAELLDACPAFSASFNSWGAAASINHLHIHLTDEVLPATRAPVEATGAVAANGAPLFRLEGYPAHHRAFSWRDASGRMALAAQLQACHAANVPYNVCFTPAGYAAVFARTRAQDETAWATYGERLGGFEMAGHFTAYQDETYAQVTKGAVASMLRAVSVPLP
mmetsp:Transcript_13890/g.37301  ORF Transcript_13890/g.37301 Transcript_13890/m.37301 type:complete len:559 (+) Transcript_13890:221-1897(+)